MYVACLLFYKIAIEVIVHGLSVGDVTSLEYALDILGTLMLTIRGCRIYRIIILIFLLLGQCSFIAILLVRSCQSAARLLVRRLACSKTVSPPWRLSRCGCLLAMEGVFQSSQPLVPVIGRTHSTQVADATEAFGPSEMWSTAATEASCSACTLPASTDELLDAQRRPQVLQFLFWKCHCCWSTCFS